MGQDKPAKSDTKSKASKVKKIVVSLLLIYLLYFFFCLIVLPLVQRKEVSGNQANAASLQATAQGTERVLCIDDNGEALKWRLKMIEAAREDIILSTFNFGNDQSGIDVMSSLLQAADRGVHIRILVDSFFGTLALNNDDSFHVLLAHENVEAKLYNPINFIALWDANYRMHDKYLVIDDTMYILGGRNTTDLFMSDYSEKVSADRDVLVYEQTYDENSSLNQVKAYFEEIWQLSCNKTMKCGKSSQEAEQALREHYQQLHEQYPDAFEEQDWIGQTTLANSVSLIYNPMSNTNKQPELFRLLCGLMAEGEDVIIQTPYVMCNREMYQGLASVTEAGANLRIITNAVSNGANPWGCSDYLNNKNKILATGSEVYEYAGPQSVHTKTVLIDDHISVIGSFNMDMRSAYLDTETMLVIDCPELNAQLREGVAEQMECSRHILTDGTVLLGDAYEEKNLGAGKSILYSVMRVLTVPIRHLL